MDDVDEVALLDRSRVRTARQRARRRGLVLSTVGRGHARRRPDVVAGSTVGLVARHAVRRRDVGRPWRPAPGRGALPADRPVHLGLHGRQRHLRVELRPRRGGPGVRRRARRRASRGRTDTGPAHPGRGSGRRGGATSSERPVYPAGGSGHRHLEPRLCCAGPSGCRATTPWRPGDLPRRPAGTPRALRLPRRRRARGPLMTCGRPAITRPGPLSVLRAVREVVLSRLRERPPVLDRLSDDQGLTCRRYGQAALP